MFSKHLKATNVQFPDKLIKIKLSETKNLYGEETEQKWLDALHLSIGQKGMLHPILVCKEEPLKDGGDLDTLIKVPVEFLGIPWRVVVGNNRYFYAISKKYDYIDAYEIKTKEDYEKYHNSTVLEAHQF
jgi:hypothetical protein